MIVSRPPKLFGPRHLFRATRQADKLLAQVAAAHTAKDFRRYKYLTTHYFQHGSAVASLAVEVVLAPVLKALPSVAIVPSYADNMLTMAKTKEDAWSVTKAMWSALRRAPRRAANAIAKRGVWTERPHNLPWP